MTTLSKFQQSELKRFDKKYVEGKWVADFIDGKPLLAKHIKSFLNSAIEKAYALGKEEGYKEGRLDGKFTYILNHKKMKHKHGFCWDCGKKSVTSYNCEEHRLKQNERNKKYKKRLKNLLKNK